MFASSLRSAACSHSEPSALALRTTTDIKQNVIDIEKGTSEGQGDENIDAVRTSHPSRKVKAHS